MIAAVTSALLQPAAAQEPASAGAPAQSVEEISVTGTRIRRDDFSNPQPTTVVTGELMNTLGIVNVGDMMSQMPANVGSYTPTAKPGGNGGDNQSFPLNVFNGSNLANLRGLNPSYGSRTLTLVDSRRHVPTNQGDGVDLNMIPTIIVDRMEVVTGGASASYGSGAIAGVVNVLLDRDFEGAKAQIDFGQTAAGEGDDLHYGFAWGGGIGADGHLIVAVEGQSMDPIDYCIETRAWCRVGQQIRLNPNWSASGNNTEPRYVHVDDVRVNNTVAGVFPGLGLQFNEDGTALLPFQSADALSAGGDGRHANAYLPLRSNVDRQVIYSAFTTNLTEDLTFFVEASAGHVESYSPQIPFDLGNQQIMHDNYYLNRLPVNPCADFTYTYNDAMLPSSPCKFAKDFKGQSDTANDTQSDLRRIVVGFNGDFGESSWNWEAYYQYGKSETLQAVYDSRFLERFNMGLDVVDDGAGNPICRVTRDGIGVYPWFSQDPRLAEGCVPINAFGAGNITGAAHDWGFGRILENTYVEQDMAEFVASGDLFELGKLGTVRAAAGISWRDESIDNPADETQPDYMRRDYQSQFGESFGGSVEVWEYFGELDIPVGDRLTFQTAFRTSDYENTAGRGTGVVGKQFGYDITTWKVNANWRTTDWLTMRASRSLDIRAPALRDLYSSKIFPGGSALAYCSNPWTGNLNQGSFTFTGDPCALNIFGNIELRPEEATTTTLGLIVTPERGDVRFAADYYTIKIEDAISAGGGAVNDCHDFRIAEQCALITGPLIDPSDPLGGFSQIESTTSYNINNRTYEFSGIDLTADWLKEFRFGGISMRVVASHMIDQLIQPSASSPALRDIAGVTGVMGGDWRAAPDWTGQWITSYLKGPLVLTAQMRYVSAGKIYTTQERVGPQDAGYSPDLSTSIDDNRSPGYTVWGLSGSYDVELPNTDLQIFGSIQNVFDREPPLLGNGAGGTNPVFYDTVGRQYRVGVRLAF